MKIGIFGGSFNPPHKMHIDIALNLINKKYVDRVIYVPTGNQYKYKNNLVQDKYRYEMLKIIANKHSNIDVSNYELKKHVVYTWKTLDYFKKKYPNDKIYFICGTDNLSYIDKWKNGIDILKNNKIIVIKRNIDNIDKILKKYNKFKDNIIVSDIEEKDISSTQIRKCLKEKSREFLNLIDKDVLEYINKNNLY